jgi:signal transduction histidine kinase
MRSLRARILLYLVALHGAFALLAAVVLLERPVWLLVAEALFLVSVGVGVLLVRAFFVPLRLIRTGAELIAEGDFTSRFVEVGQPEMDELIRVYNRMIDRLREERLALREQRHLLDAVLEVSPLGVLILDFDGRIAAANPAAHQLIGGNEGTLTAGLRLAEFGHPVARALATLPAGAADVIALADRRRLRCAHGRLLDRGFPRSFFLVLELTRELQASEREAYRRLVRLMAHEVNNSAGAVGSLLESVRSGLPAGLAREAAAEPLEIAGARLRALGGFMGGLADVFRLPEPEPRPCDVAALVRDILVLLAPELERRRLEVHLDLPPAPVVVEADRHQLEQVLVNVVRNAAEAIGEEGEIHIGCARHGAGWRCTLRDTGGGLPEGLADQLFTPLVSTKRDGRGLGLALVAEILGRHGWGYGLRNVEGGAEFWIEIPGR